MNNKMVLEFIDNDSEYIGWLNDHSEGYVINTSSSKMPTYMVLHRAYCSFISEYNEQRKVGGFTERDYIKVCSDDLDLLRKWLQDHGRYDGCFSSECDCTQQDNDSDWE